MSTSSICGFNRVKSLDGFTIDKLDPSKCLKQSHDLQAHQEMLRLQNLERIIDGGWISYGGELTYVILDVRFTVIFIVLFISFIMYCYILF